MPQSFPQLTEKLISVTEINIIYNGNQTIKIKKDDFMKDRNFTGGCLISYRMPDIINSYKDPDYDSKQTPGKNTPSFNQRESMKNGIGEPRNSQNRQYLWCFLVFLMNPGLKNIQGNVLTINSDPFIN